VADGGSSLALGLTLAIGSAAAINLGFLLQHRGLARVAAPAGETGGLAVLRRSFTRPEWLAGQALGIAGFAAQVAAVAIAPLALVQAFAAGGLALSLPLAVVLFRARVRGLEAAAVLAIAAALGSLPIGLPAVHEHLSSPTLAVLAAGALGLAAAAARTGQPPWLAVAGGLCYGAADAAIKAVAVLYGGEGRSVVVWGWLAVAGIATLAGFIAFQAALRTGGAVSAVTLMSAAAALVALACGLIALGEPFGSGPLTTGGHLVAVGVVLLCVRPLAAAQVDLLERAS
jgi:hypothetical protein